MTNAHDPRTLEDRLQWIADWSEPGIDLADAGTAREALDTIKHLRAELARAQRNRDMWKGQCERQADELARVRKLGDVMAFHMDEVRDITRTARAAIAKARGHLEEPQS